MSNNDAAPADAGSTTPAADAALSSVGSAPLSSDAGAESAIGSNVAAASATSTPTGPVLTDEHKRNLQGLDQVLEALFAAITPEEFSDLVRSLPTPSVALEKLDALRAKIRDLSK